MTIIGHGYGANKATPISHGYGSPSAGVVVKVVREIMKDMAVRNDVMRQMAVSAGTEKYEGGA